MDVLKDHVSAEWKDIGRELGLNENKIKVIEADIPKTNERFIEMLCTAQRSGILKSKVVRALKYIKAEPQVVQKVQNWQLSLPESYRGISYGY